MTATTSKHNSSNMKNNGSYSLLKGYSFSFDDEGKEILAWFSSLSGRETIYVDGELVSSQRNISMKSSNNFMIGDNKYSITLKIVNVFKGPVICTLTKNGKEYRRKELVFSHAHKQSQTPLEVARTEKILGVLLLPFFILAFWLFPIHHTSDDIIFTSMSDNFSDVSGHLPLIAQTQPSYDQITAQTIALQEHDNVSPSFLEGAINNNGSLLFLFFFAAVLSPFACYIWALVSAAKHKRWVWFVFTLTLGVPFIVYLLIYSKWFRRGLVFVLLLGILRRFV
jgi:hypothetical protein